MRLTAVCRGIPVDVAVDDGVPVARLCGWLARLTGDAAWTTGTPTADGVPLHADDPVGHPPLGHGAILRPGPGPLPDAVLAALAPLHLAAVAGPDTGALLVPDGPAALGPVVVRPAARGTGLVVRRVHPGRVLLGRRRVPRAWWRRWRLGDELRVGGSVMVLRGGAARADESALPAPAHGSPSDRPPHPSAPGLRGRLAPLLRFLPAVASAVTSAVLAASLRQPVLLLGALSALVLVVPAAGPAPAAPSDDHRPTDLAALRVALAAGHPAPCVAPPFSWDDDLTVTGPRSAALATARAVLLACLAHDDPPVTVHTDHPGDWSWLVWHRGAGPGRPLVVVDSDRDPPSHGADQRVLRVVDGPPPPWSRTVLEVDGTSARLRGADGRWRPSPVVGVSTATADATARALARHHGDPAVTADAAGHALIPRHGDPADRRPADVLLGALPGVPPPDPAAVATAWDRPPVARQPSLASAWDRPPVTTRPSLATPIGAGPRGPVAVDLIHDGPHALVAGTTGSGKSELLTTLVVGLALAHPPDRLAVLLVDFKGGTGLPALTGLPHVVGRLSDLDAAGARRTLRGLFAELHRRKRVLGAHAAGDLRDLDPADPATPPRLLVVVDEFRVLADELPDLLPGLARVAAQGRSLGVHLVLATQRPAGALPADLRANVGLRVVLRVTDPADSVDLVGVPDAATIARPGLALLARGAGASEPVQVARAAPRRSGAIRLADPWPPPARPAWVPPGATPPSSADGPAPWVAAMRTAAAHRPRVAEPWLPPPPARVTTGDVPPGPGLPVALADLPDDLARGPVRWDPDTGHLLVLGGPGSGRSTALAAVASAALSAGRAVHAVGLPAHLVPAGTASALDADDATRVARLVRLLGEARPGPGPRPLLVLDDVGPVLAGLATVARGEPAERLDQLWATAGGPVAVVASGGIGPATTRLTAHFADRLVLGSPEPTADALAGVPADLAGPRPLPGRAVHVGRSGAALCQVALPASPPAGPVPPAPPGVRPLPGRAPLPTGPVRSGASHPTVPLGLGGDLATVVSIDLDRPLLVVGPPGSGRTTALAVLAAGAEHAGLRIVPAVPPGDVPAAAADPTLLVIDDLDDLEAADPSLTDALAARLAGPHPPRLVAATTTAHAVASFRGPVPLLVAARRLLVLDLVEPGSVDLLGPEGAWLVDRRRHPPGRGALRLGRDVTPVQVFAPG